MHACVSAPSGFILIVVNHRPSSLYTLLLLISFLRRVVSTTDLTIVCFISAHNNTIQRKFIMETNFNIYFIVLAAFINTFNPYTNALHLLSTAPKLPISSRVQILPTAHATDILCDPESDWWIVEAFLDDHVHRLSTWWWEDRWWYVCLCEAVPGNTTRAEFMEKPLLLRLAAHFSLSRLPDTSSHRQTYQRRMFPEIG